MAKKKSVEDRFFPIATIPTLSQPIKPPENPDIVKKIIQGAVQASYQMKLPDSYDLECRKNKLIEMRATEEQMQFVTHLIQSLQPADAIEATLASQYVISYVRGLSVAKGNHSIVHAFNCFEFGHRVLSTLARYRTKGVQLINVQYNHNQGQINNIQVVQQDNESKPIIEVS